MLDLINNPPHYQMDHGLQSIDVIEGLKIHKDFALGNCLKYLMRASKKGTYLEDLKKAEWYLRYLIELEDEVADD